MEKGGDANGKALNRLLDMTMKKGSHLAPLKFIAYRLAFKKAWPNGLRGNDNL